MQVVARRSVETRKRPHGQSGYANAARPAATRLHILENPVSAQNPRLGAAVEDALQAVLGGANLGALDVRFRVCREEADGAHVKFICKVEGPAPADPERENVQWRWWSPLLETADEFRSALREALEIRSQRLTSLTRPISA